MTRVQIHVICSVDFCCARLCLTADLPDHLTTTQAYYFTDLHKLILGLQDYWMCQITF